MRILVTNDDGVFSPGIAALAGGMARAAGGEHEVVVVAPLADHSGAGAAVGAVYERESIPYEAVEIPGLEHVPTFGVDGPPALATILACIEGFGPRPDIVVSGVNNGANVGRSALHSGTIGAALTGAQFGLRGLAVSTTWGADPVPWDTPVAVAESLFDVIAGAPPGTVLNLNVPALPLHQVRGVRHARLSQSGLIRSVRSHHLADGSPIGGPATGELPAPGMAGAVRLALRDASTEPGATDGLDPDSDAALLAAGWATITPLAGVREDGGAHSDLLPTALAAATALLGTPAETV